MKIIKKKLIFILEIIRSHIREGDGIDYKSALTKLKDKTYPCMLGRNGVKKDKYEGDGSTPYGEYPIRRVYFRNDRIGNNLKNLSIPTQKLKQNDAWSDDVDSSDYNKYIKLPSIYSYENLWRNDHLYDIIAVIGYNDDPVVKGKGSAIFVHIMSPERKPTAGCISFVEKNLVEILKNIDLESKIIIH